MQASRPTPMLLLAFPFVFLAGGGVFLYRIWKDPERSLDESVREVSGLYYNLPPPEEFRSMSQRFEEVTASFLEKPKLRARAHQRRLYFYAMTLQQARLEQEYHEYRRETSSFSNKDFVFTAPQVLFDMASSPAPDSATLRRLEPYRKEAAHDIDWYRPVLLKKFVDAKKLLADDRADCRTRAAAEFTEVLRYAPDFAPAYLLRGKAKLSAGEGAAALDDFRQAARLDPGLAEAHRWSAEALEQSGHVAEALAELAVALAMDPEYREAADLRKRLSRR